MKIAHVITDEKFPDSAFEMFEEVCRGCNVFILPDKKSQINHLEKIKPLRVGKYSYLNPKFVKYIGEFDALIIHSMNAFSLELVNRSNSDLKVYWIGMGYDYYDIIAGNRLELIKDKTKKSILEELSPPLTGKQFLIKKLRVLRDYFLYPRRNKKIENLSRVNYFCPVLESEFYAVKDKIDFWSAEYIDWNDGNSSNLLDGKYGCQFSLGNNILLGNSATTTNNHIDALEFLKENEFFLQDGAKIIVPLSYGDFRYREVVVSHGRKLFGEKFVPLMKMVSPSEYRKIINACDLVFMNHIRQQAGNNIAQALFMGARVVLDAKNPFYDDYKRHGVYLTSIDEVEENPKLLSTSLTSNEVSFNQFVLNKLRGREAAIEKTRHLVDSIQRNISN